MIGEAARCLPTEIRDAIPEVAWSNVIGMRNILTHAYFGTDTEILWSAATEKIAPLKRAVEVYISGHFK